MIKIFSDPDELNHYAADKFIEIGNSSIDENGRFTVALAGGSTPKTLYKLLTSDKNRSQLDWSKVFFFIGDERFVAPDDAESNYRMAKENIFSPLDVKAENIFRWQTEQLDPDKTAERYSNEISAFFELKSGEFPRFDLILLGMGDDGHTASLFPHTAALKEIARIAAANPVEKLDTVRLTFTLPTINNAANIIFLVTGAEKSDILAKILNSEPDPDNFPSQAVNPPNGRLFWLVDEAAAKNLK